MKKGKRALLSSMLLAVLSILPVSVPATANGAEEPLNARVERTDGRFRSGYYGARPYYYRPYSYGYGYGYRNPYSYGYYRPYSGYGYGYGRPYQGYGYSYRPYGYYPYSYGYGYNYNNLYSYPYYSGRYYNYSW